MRHFLSMRIKKGSICGVNEMVNMKNNYEKPEFWILCVSGTDAVRTSGMYEDGWKDELGLDA